MNKAIFKYLGYCLPTALCLSLALSAAATAQQAESSEDRLKLKLGNRILLDGESDGFMSIRQIRYSPDGKYFAVIGCGYECNDNAGFLFNADGTGKRKFTEQWDFILQDKVEWSADGQRLYYYRINSTGADPPANAPPEGWIEINLKTGRKAPASSRALKPETNYRVFNVLHNDWLNLREAPGVAARITAKLPPDAAGIRFTGVQRKIGRTVWVKIEYAGVTGWVNQNYLYEESKEK